MQIPLNDLDEARRVLDICNACRYCEGLCGTFKAMTDYRSFAQADLNYLANLCHNCTACYHDCQYAPPHEFDVNVPVALSRVRTDSYQQYAWPGMLARGFRRNGWVVCSSVALVFAVFVGVVSSLLGADRLSRAFTGPGSFYQVVDHGVMMGTAGLTFGFALLCMAAGARRFWRDLGGGGLTAVGLARALRDAAQLRHLDGGHGAGCNVADDRPTQRRRVYHQLTMWGFALCFAATCVATWYHYGLGLVAPYALLSWPVVLGTVGGIGLLVGPAGLMHERRRLAEAVRTPDLADMDDVLSGMLILVSLTGLVLLAARETAAMPVLLLTHLGLVLGFFVAIPYSKFVHMVYRLLALLHFHR